MRRRFETPLDSLLRVPLRLVSVRRIPLLLVPALLLGACGGETTEIDPTSEPPVGEAAPVAGPSRSLESLPVPDEATVPSELVDWVDRALAAGEPATDGGDAGACDDVIRRAASAEVAKSGYGSVPWREALERAYEDLDVACATRMHSIAGLAAIARSDYAAALDHLHRAAYVAARTGDAEAYVSARQDATTTRYRLGHYDEVLDSADDLRVWLDQLPRDHYNVWRRAVALHVEGRTLVALGRPADALPILRRSLEVRAELERRWPRPDAPGAYLVPGHQALGRALLDAGDAEAAEPHLEKALQLTLAMAGNRRTALLDLAALRLEQNQAAAARRLLGEARALEPETGDFNVDDSFQIDYVDARALERLGDAEGALRAAERLMSKLESFRALSQTELTQAFFHRRSFYADLYLRLLLEQGREVEAFEAVEALRSRGLLDAILWPASRLLDEASPREAERARRLREEFLQILASDDASGPLLETREALIRLESALRRKAGAMAADTVSVTEARSLLAEGDLFLSFWPLRDGVVVWILDGPQGDLRAATLAPAERLESSVLSVTAALRSGRSRSARLERELADLGAALLGPVEEELKRSRRLVVAAEGILGTLPFAALPHPDGRRLVRSHSVLHVHSLSVLAAIRSRESGRDTSSTRWRRDFAAVADPDYLPASDGRPPAPASGDAARRIARLISDAGGRAQVSTGAGASRRSVLGGALSASRYAHFGAHVELDPALPDRSAIRLAETDSSAPANSALYLRDLPLLDLDAEVVSLAGCETAGEVRRGAEGPMALPRGFLHAGAGSVVASLWQVHDRPTAELMVAFYGARVGDGLDPAEALRRAQLHLLDGGWSALRHWAGFVVLGDGSPPAHPIGPAAHALSTDSARWNEPFPRTGVHLHETREGADASLAPIQHRAKELP